MISFKTYGSIRPVSREVIKSAVDNSDGKEIIFVAPEFAKAEVEREVLAFKEGASEGNGTIDTGDEVLTLSSSLISGDVVSFRRLAGNILDELGINYVAEGGEMMLRNAIYNILTNNKDKLKAFGALSSRIDYINMMIALLGDFSRYGVGADDIEQAIKALDNATSSPAFVNKLKDLLLIMKELEDINFKYNLNLLREPIALACERLESVDPAKLSRRRSGGLAAILRSKIVFVGFGATRLLTPKELRLVSLLSDKGCDIEFNVLINKSDSMFSAVCKNGEDFRQVLRSLGAAESELNEEERTDILSRIVNAYASDHVITESDEEGVLKAINAQGTIMLAELANVDDRVGYVFNEIINLTRKAVSDDAKAGENKKIYRYKDIRIVCCSEDLMSRMRSTAELYHLDIFIDRKIALGGTVVPYMMQILLELPRSNYSLDLIMKAMRSGMLSVPPYIADSFENYCYARNITDAVRLFDPKAYVEPEDPEHKGKRLIWIREKTVPGYEEGFTEAGGFFYRNIVEKKLIPLKEACESIFSERTLSGKAKASLAYFDKMSEFIGYLKDEFVEKGDDASASALVRGYDELINLLLCSTHEMNDCEISQKDFLSMIRTDMKNRTEGTIPLKVDSIEITTPEHAFVTPCKVLFIIGAQKDNFPYVRMREGLLSGIELKALSGAAESIELPDKAVSKMREEFVSACLLLGAASDKLYMVHEYGAPKSRVFEYLENYVDNEHHIVNTFRNPIAGHMIKLRHDFESATIDTKDMERLLTADVDGEKKQVITASVSSIESFRSCAFQFMLDRYLKIAPREDNTSVKANSFGSLIHDMFETAFGRSIEESGKDPEKYKELAMELLADEERYVEFADQCLKKAVSKRARFGSVDEEGNPTDKTFEMDTYAKLRRMFSKMFRDVLGDTVSTGYIPQAVEAQIGKDGLELDVSYDGIELHFTGKIDRYDVKEDEEGRLHFRTIDYKSGDKAVETKELLNGTQIQLPVYSGAILDMNKKEGKDAVVDDYGYVLVGLKAEMDKDPLSCEPGLSGYNEEAMKVAISYSKHIVKESVDQISHGKADAVTATQKIKLCSYCSYKGYCGNNPSNSKGRKQVDTSSKSDVGKIVDKFNKYKKGDLKKMPSYDETTTKIGMDDQMEGEDKRAILAMKEILDKADEKKSGKED